MIEVDWRQVSSYQWRLRAVSKRDRMNEKASNTKSHEIGKG